MSRLRLIAPPQLVGNVSLPASKSVSNRLLLLDALCPVPGMLHGVALCDDTHAMQQALAATCGTLDVGAAGTAMRFATALLAVRQGCDVVLTGSERMCERPIGVLVSALRELGARIDYVGREGFPPLHIVGAQLHPAHLTMPAHVSSQFISAVAMILPVVGGGSITLEGEVVSRPYIDMTLALMRRYGAQATFAGHTIEVAGGAYEPQELTVEADWSAASYWYALAALLPGSEITLPGLERDSLQGDSAVQHMMSPLGVTTEWLPAGGVRLSGRPTCNCPAHLDMTATPDLAQTLAVTLCLLGRPFRLTGLRSLRIKETDRLEGLRSQLAKVGYLLTVEGDEALSWDGDRCEPQPNPVIDTLHDHRMAMAMALCAVKHPGVVIDDAQVVTKSYPAFWQQLGQAGFTIVQLS